VYTPSDRVTTLQGASWDCGCVGDAPTHPQGLGHPPPLGEGNPTTAQHMGNPKAPRPSLTLPVLGGRCRAAALLSAPPAPTKPCRHCPQGHVPGGACTCPGSSFKGRWVMGSGSGVLKGARGEGGRGERGAHPLPKPLLLFLLHPQPTRHIWHEAPTAPPPQAAPPPPPHTHTLCKAGAQLTASSCLHPSHIDGSTTHTHTPPQNTQVCVTCQEEAEPASRLHSQAFSNPPTPPYMYNRVDLLLTSFD
jgi:hypothetical protein